MVHGNMYDHSSLCSIIVNYTRTVARSASGDTCFGFPRLISLIMERYGVNVKGQKRMAIHLLDTVNIMVLHSLKFLLTIIKAIECEAQVEEEEQYEEVAGHEDEANPSSWAPPTHRSSETHNNKFGRWSLCERSLWTSYGR